LDLFNAVFAKWICILSDRRAFFRTLLEAAADKLVSDATVVSFGLDSPCDFFDEIVHTPRYPQLTDLLFQRWSSPDRGVLLHFLMYIIEHLPKSAAGEFEKIYVSVAQRIAYVGNCKQYLGIANDDGEVLIIGKDSGKILWKQKCFSNPISFVSISSGGERFAVISLRDGLLTWVVATKGKSGITGFDLAGTIMLSTGIAPVSVSWKGASKLRLESQTGQILAEVSAPRTGWIF
jgi:hypothetical protein